MQIVSWSASSLPEADEWPWIAELARHLGLPTHRIEADEHLPFSALDLDAVDSETPIYNPFRPLFTACYQTSKSIDRHVLLNAACGDGLYPHPSRALLDTISRREWLNAARQMRRILRTNAPHRLHRVPALRAVVRALLPLPIRPQPAPEWLGPAAIEAWTGEIQPWPAEGLEARHPDHARHLFAPEASAGAARERRFSLRYGIDRRDPYLDFELRRLMFNAPHSLIWRDGQSKWIAARGHARRTARVIPNQVPHRLAAFFIQCRIRAKSSKAARTGAGQRRGLAAMAPESSRNRNALENSAMARIRDRLLVAYCVGFFSGAKTSSSEARPIQKPGRGPGVVMLRFQLSPDQSSVSVGSPSKRPVDHLVRRGRSQVAHFNGLTERRPFSCVQHRLSSKPAVLS